MTKTTEETPTALAHIPQAGRELMDVLGIRFGDPEAIGIRIAAKLANATSLDELLDPGGPSGLRQHLGEPFYIRGVEFMPGSFEAGPGFYALIDAVTAEGEPVAFTSGATNVLVQLAKGQQEGWWDNVLVQARQTDEPTANGYYPYRLVKA